MHHIHASRLMEPAPSPVSRAGATLARGNRFLVPVMQAGDVEAVLSYLPTLDGGGDVHLSLLHVTSTTDAISAPARPGFAEVLLEQVESRCRADSITFDSHIVAGDPVFSILDAAELLACDAILLPVLKSRPWHYFFLTKTARDMQRLQRDVPLLLISADGAVIRSIAA